MMSLPVWSHAPMLLLCPWFHVPSGDVSVYGVSVRNGLCLGGLSLEGVLYSDPLESEKRVYESYWNAFLFLNVFTEFS